MLNVAVLGCGKIAQVRHIPEYAANENVRLVGFYNPTASRAEDMAKKYGGKVYLSPEELLADPEVEAKTLAVTGGWKWPVGITFTTDESDKLDMLGGNSNLNTYVAENYASFITGSKDINSDADWEAYLAGFSALNLDKIMAIRQGALDRYEAR